MPQRAIQTSFASGELSPGLLGHVDLAKYHTGAALMKNFFVDVKGGASTRPGTQAIMTAAGTALLVPFIFSSTQTYMLVFTQFLIKFIRNPLTTPYPNSSNAGPIQSGGGDYSVASPWAAADFSLLKFSQSGDVLTVTHPAYVTQEIRRVTDTNWTITGITLGKGLGSPSGLTVTITGLPAGSTDPQTTNYLYAVTTVDKNGQEGAALSIVGVTGINIASTPGNITLKWNPVTGAKYYNVYKTIPAVGGTAAIDFVQPGASWGFCGFIYGTSFTDSNIVPDFAQAPPVNNYPFTIGTVIDYVITNGGATYPPGISATTLSITDANGATATLFPIISTNISGATGSIIGIFIAEPGHNIADGAAIVASGGAGAGFAGTVKTLQPLGMSGGINPSTSAYFQQRRVYASSLDRPLTIWGSRPGFYDNFSKTNPTIDSDSYEFTVAAQQVNAIKHMTPMPGGLVLFSDAGVSQLTGGSSNPTNPAAVTPTSAVVVPQSYFGASDLKPIVINYDILFNQSEGSLVRKLTYNFFVNIYTGTDITVLASHLFYPLTLIAWAYQDSPFKTIWCVRSDGALLSLTYLPEQDIMAWAQHNTNGTFEQVAVVREGATDAVYFVVNRGGSHIVERLCDRVYTQVSDAWCLDSALSYQGAPLSHFTGLSSLNGFVVYALADGLVQGPFTVSGGAVDLTTAASKVVIGLAFTAQLQTMPLDAGEPTMAGRRKSLNSATLRVRDTAGLKWGPDFTHLTTYRQGVSFTGRPETTEVTGLITGDMPLNIGHVQTTLGQLCVQQDQPLPATVLAVIAEFEVGDQPSR